MSVFMPFDHVKKLIRETLNIDISVTCLQDVAYKIGVKLYKNMELKGRRPYSLKKEKKPIDTLYLQSDGSMVPISGAEELEYKENKLGLIYTDNDIVHKISKNGNERIEINNKRFVSSIGEGVDKFKKMFYAAAIEKGLRSAKTIIFLSDGALWLRKLKEEYFPNAIQILDWYHVIDHLWSTAHALFGEENNKKCEEWVTPLKDLLWNGRVNDVLKILLKEGNTRKHNQTPIWELRAYFMSNKENMKYAEFRRKGYYIGSGAVESANKYIVSDRLKRTGMRWTLSNANAMIWLRCKYFEDRWDEFWESMKLAEYLVDHGETHMVQAA